MQLPPLPRRSRRWPLLLVLLMLAVPTVARAQRAIVLVRHGEKLDESSQARLSPLGHQRATRLAELLAPLGIRAIFATTVERTQQTAQPLADKLGLPLVLLPPTERATLMARLAALPASDAALVVGHADTLPLLLKDLGVKEAVAIGPRDYGQLFIVIPRPGSPPTLLRLAF